MQNYYSPEELKRWEEHGRQFTVEEIRSVERRWAALVDDVKANPTLDPASEEAQELGRRWSELIEATFKGNTELMAEIGKGYQQGRFADQPAAPTPEIFEFIGRVSEARK